MCSTWISLTVELKLFSPSLLATSARISGLLTISSGVSCLIIASKFLTLSSYPLLSLYYNYGLIGPIIDILPLSYAAELY